MVCVTICALLLSESTLRAQSAEPATAIERLNRFQAALRDARGRSDWASYRAAAQQIKQLLNGSPQSRLEMARAEIHVGRATAAMDELTAYVRTGQSSELIEKLPDFEAMRQRKEFAAVRVSMAGNREAIARATVAFHIPDPQVLPEDIDFDPHAKRFLISSVLQHRIVSIAGDGALVEFAKAPDDWPVLALKIDARRKVAWATEVAMEAFGTVIEADRGRSAVLCYDLNTGKLLRRIEGPRPSALGDMTLTAEGSVIVSDGEHGGLYQLKPGAEQLERLDHGDFISPQTVVMASDATHAYVPDYVRGLGVFDLETKQVRWLPMGGRYALDGIDGLYRLGDQLIAVQNGASPPRVVLLSMDTDGTKIVAEQVIERATATLGVPTHGVIVDGAFYYIANSGWDALGANGVVESGATLTQSVVMKWKLSRNGRHRQPPT
jgi:hypothetical protein